MNKVYEIYCSDGLTALAKRAMRKFLYHVFHKNDALWVFVDTAEFVQADTRAKLSARAWFDLPQETIEYIRKEGYYNPREIEVGLSNAHLFSRLTIDGNIVGYNKLAFNEVYIYDFDRILRLPEHIAFTYDTTITGEERSQGLGAFVLSEAIKEAIRRGVYQIWGHIPPWNKASLRMHQKLGFKVARHIHFYYLLGMKFYSFEPEKLFDDFLRLTTKVDPERPFPDN